MPSDTSRVMPRPADSGRLSFRAHRARQEAEDKQTRLEAYQAQFEADGTETPDEKAVRESLTEHGIGQDGTDWGRALARKEAFSRVEKPFDSPPSTVVEGLNSVTKDALEAGLTADEKARRRALEQLELDTWLNNLDIDGFDENSGGEFSRVLK